MSDGAHKSKQDSSGVDYHLHLLRETDDRSAATPHARKPNPAQTIAKADADTCHAAYSALLAEAPLLPRHREALRRRGFTDELIDRHQFGSLPEKQQVKLAAAVAKRVSPDVLPSVPGFILNDRGNLSISATHGLLFAVCGLDEKIIAVRSRPDERGDGGPKYRSLSSASRGGPKPGSQVHVPLGVRGPAGLVRVTEGEIKAIVAWLRSGIPTISIPGVAVWRLCLSVLRTLGCRVVRLAYDADAWTKKEVAGALVEFHKRLVELGYEVEIERWDAGLDGKVKGIDDALVAGIPIEVLTGDRVLEAIAEASRVAGAELAKTTDRGPATSRDPKELFESLKTRAKLKRPFSELLGDAEFNRDFAELKIRFPSNAGIVETLLAETLGPKFKFKIFKAKQAEFQAIVKRELSGGANSDFPDMLLGDTDDPHRLARSFLLKDFSHADGPTLVYHKQSYWTFEGTCYQEYKDVTEDLTASIKDDFDRHATEAFENYKEGMKLLGDEDAPQAPPRLAQVTTAIVNNASQALRSETVLSSAIDPPCWVGKDGLWADRDPRMILSADNGLVDLTNCETLPHTPRFFSSYALSYSWVETAPKPARFMQFLNDELWPGDPASVRELQKFFGLYLTLNTSYQKILMLIGPPGAGKGTICRVLTKMVGEQNVVSPSLPSLAGQFGLGSLANKALCIFTDALALGSSNDRPMILENILKISGEDPVSIERKYKDSITMRLTTRLMFAMSQPPNFRDPSGALMRRVIPLQLRETWSGREDRNLSEALYGELPGILRHFARDGIELLKEDKGFLVPESAKSLIADMGELLSPVTGFANECLEIIPGEDKRPADELPAIRDVFDAYQEWCRETKHESGSSNIFGRNLRATYPRINAERPQVEDEERVRRYRGLKLNSHGETLRDRFRSRSLARAG